MTPLDDQVKRDILNLTRTFSQGDFSSYMQRENTDVEMDPNRGEVRSHNSRLKWQTFGEFAGLLIRNAEK